MAKSSGYSYEAQKENVMAESSGYSYEAKIASRGYHVYKKTTWTNARVGHKVKVGLETNKQSIKIGPYACAEKSVLRHLENSGAYPSRNIPLYALFYQRRRCS